jgi:hypothetical protein
VARVIHFRLRDLPADRAERVHEQVAQLAASRDWRSQPAWIASDLSRGLFETEYLRHLRNAEGAAVSAAGFLKMGGDETDALVLLLFLRDLSAEYGLRLTWRDESHPFAKLRHLELESGLLSTGRRLEDLLARRPIIKKVMGQSISFYPPNFRLHSQAPPKAGPGTWGYALHGLRAYAPTLLEAEREALKILRGLRHLS